LPKSAILESVNHPVTVALVGLRRYQRDRTAMPEPATLSHSRYLAAGVRTLYEACHGSGRDEGGNRCPACCIRDLCEQSRRPAAGDNPED
jgi:hypothetical protein